MRDDLGQLDEKIIGREYFKLKKYEKSLQLDILFKRGFDLYYSFAQANVNLSESTEKNIKLDGWELESESMEYKMRFFVRMNKLKSAILMYNSVEDYILQIIAFAYKLNLKYYSQVFDYSKINCKKDFQNKIKKINYSNVEAALTESAYEDIKSIIYNYKNDVKVSNLRDSTNDIKHKRDFFIHGFSENSNKGIVQLANQGIYDCEWTNNDEYDIEQIIDTCYEVQPIIRKYVSDVYNNIAQKYGIE